MQRTRFPRISSLLLATAVALSLTASGCAIISGGSSGASQDGQDGAAPTPSAAAPSSGSTPSASASATADSTFAVPGYAVGEIPPVPLFALPNLSLLSASTGAFTPDVTSSLTSVPGITVSPARCDEPGVLASGSTSTVVTGDGGVVTSDGDSSVVNDGNGAGMVTQGSVSIVNDGNGAGTYTDTATGVSIINSGNGAGSYTDAHLSVTVDGTGGGSYTNSQTGESITITGDGSGTYTAGTVSIVNDSNGAGTYTDTATGLNIVNNGDGSALITSASGSRTVDAEKLPAVENVGSFPPIDAASPVESCGTVMTLQDGVLFDFGSSQVRSDAAQTLKNLADAMNRAGASSGHVYGHTDSVSDDSFNQTLSEQRAQAVVDALVADGATALLDATGYGESQPVAPNENSDGSDNPAGRQLNRRVEVFIPAS